MKKNTLQMHTNTKTESQRLIYLLIVGIISAIKKGSLTILDSEYLFFSPYSVDTLKEISISTKIMEKMMWLGCELEDVESIIPDKLDESLDEIYDMAIAELNKLPAVNPRKSKKWLDRD